MEPVTAAIGGIAWVLSTVLASNPAASGAAGFALNAVISGVLGNEAHRLYRDGAAAAVRHLRGLSAPENHDLARAVRTAQADALKVLLKDYKTLQEAAWRAAPGTRPVLFLDRMFVACDDMRAACAAKSFAFDTTVTETLRAAFEGLLADAAPGGAASLRTAALAGFTEDAVLEDLRATLGGVAIPAEFEALFRHGAEGRPRFLELFGAFFSEQIKAREPVRAILTTKFLARIEGLAFDTTEILFRIETQFGAKLDTILRRQQEAADAAARRHAEQAELDASRHAEVTDGQRRLERLFIDTAGSGAAAVQAVADIRDLLRPGNPDIDSFPAERLPGLVQRILEQLRKPTVIEEGFSGAVKRALAEAQARIADLAFSDAAHVLDAQLAQVEGEDRDRARGRAALLAERGRVASLQLRYHEAAGFHRRAADAVAFDPPTAWQHLNDAAGALFDQGTEFGDAEALVASIAVYRALLLCVPRESMPLRWAMAQSSLGTALFRLGERESGTARLEEAVEAHRAALLEWTRERMPLEWALTQNNLGAALSAIGERESHTIRLEEAVEAYRAALLEWTREHAPLDWARTQNNLGVVLRSLGERESGRAKLEAAVEACRAALSEWTREREPLEWARTQNNLGNALSTLGERENGSARLEEAVEAYSAALLEWTRERVPLDWATTQTNLGNALARLGKRESSTARLEAAIEAYRAALLEHTRERVPLAWAMTQTNLGAALSSIGERESGTARLEEAVKAYRAAILEMTRERVPLGWAQALNNLGTALGRLGEREHGTGRLEEAVEAFRAALVERTRERVPLDWAMTQENLGNALRIIGERESGTERLEEAVEAYSAALLEITRERAPLGWARTQMNLGNALTRLGEREGDATWLERAAIAYRAALLETTCECEPLSWGHTQYNLGVALSLLGDLEGGTARLAEAVRAWEACLTVLVSAVPPEWVDALHSRVEAERAEIARRLAG